MESTLVANFEHVLLYENPALQAKAKQVLPEEELHEQANSKLASVNKDIGKQQKPLDLQVRKYMD